MQKELIDIINRLLNIILFLLAILIVLPFIIIYRVEIKQFFKNKEEVTIIVKDTTSITPTETFWSAAEINSIKDETLKTQVLYGKDLIVHTSKYFGPKGSVMKISNGMNCQNCHLDAGTKTFGNNYGSVASLYPKFRPRSGSVENIYKRVNDCIERSLNGKALDTLGKEMQAIKAYITFIGSNVKKGEKAKGSGLKELAYLNRAANPIQGKATYVTKCQSCHQANGEGTLNPTGTEYTYPPLWGNNSYNDGAGLYRVSNFAKYVKYNMPFGASYDHTQLTDEESWDLAAYINAQPRPHKNTPKDWPDISKKPVDHPFGPFADTFSITQHKFGPFQPIADVQKKANSK
ncbi:MAG TPA: c-type cytochrome [Chitinophagales bacterium]|nr:c-type cytochrome [Chitinophagales bacterium]